MIVFRPSKDEGVLERVDVISKPCGLTYQPHRTVIPAWRIIAAFVAKGFACVICGCFV